MAERGLDPLPQTPAPGGAQPEMKEQGSIRDYDWLLLVLAMLISGLGVIALIVGLSWTLQADEKLLNYRASYIFVCIKQAGFLHHFLIVFHIDGMCSLFGSRQNRSKLITMIIDNNNTTLCTDVEDTLGQKSIMNLLSNEFTRMGYGKSVSKILFNDVETTFANVQRGNCGFIYAGEQTLAKLLNAFERSGTKYDILPIWYSDQNVKNEQLRQESKEQNKLVNAQKRKEKLEQEQELAAIRAEADGVLKKKQQEELRKLHNNIVKAHIQRMEKEAKLLLDEDPKNTGEILSHYPDLVDFMKQKLKEKWELSNSSVEINDYGDGNYAGRTIETFITDIKFKLMNRNIGKYEDFCVRVAFLDDQEFARYREPEIRGECTPSNFDSYKKKLRFQSKWIVQ